MKHYYLITNVLKDPDFERTEAISQYIQKNGGACRFLRMDGNEKNYQETLLSDIPADTECILVIGGDGTLIKAARETTGLHIPLIGLNLGHLGYLCELEEDTVYPAIDRLFEDQFVEENRMMLEGYVMRDGKELVRRQALNDIVIHRSGSLHVIAYHLSVNGHLLARYNADGMIVATPTGSTAYSMSAGGPIIDPRSSMILLTPINSHTLNNRSIVLDPEAELLITLPSMHGDPTTRIDLSFDGTQTVTLQPDDAVHIKKAAESIRILKLSQRSFLEILQRKLQIYG